MRSCRKVCPNAHRKRIRHKLNDGYYPLRPWSSKVLKKSYHPINKAVSQLECTKPSPLVSSSHISGTSDRLQTSGIIRIATAQQIKPPTKYCWSCEEETNGQVKVLQSILTTISSKKRNNSHITASFKPLQCLITSLFLLLITKSACVRCWENPSEGMEEYDVLGIEDILPEDARTYNKMMPPKPESCVDQNDRCPDWTDDCLTDEYVIKTCPRACGTCSGDGLSPTNVYFHVTVMTLDSIDETSMTYTSDVFFGQTWKDDRLRFPLNNMTTEYRLLPVEWLRDIWRPDSFFKNAKSVTFQTMTVPNHYLWLYKNGNILYMVKLTLTLSCAMQFTKYPHDTQHCALQIESLSHTTQDMIYEWEPVIPLVVDESIELPQLDLISNVTGDCTQYYSTGNFTCLEIIFTFKRRLGYFIFHTYIPTCLIVIMSWISFWIKPEAIPARVTLGVTSLLTLSTQHHNAQKSLPHVSYTKAIDLFMSTCTAFVFASMMEYAVINWILGGMDSKKLETSYRRHVTERRIKELKSPETIIKRKTFKPWRSLSTGSIRRRGYSKMVCSPSCISQVNGGELLQEQLQEQEIEDLADNKEPENEELLDKSDEEKIKSPSDSKGSDSSARVHMSRSRLRSNSKVRWEKGLLTPEDEEEDEAGTLLDRSNSVSTFNLAKFAADEYLKAREIAMLVDTFSRIAFPSSFALINIMYWIEYEVKGR